MDEQDTTLVSVVVPVGGNRGTNISKIKKCVESIFHQDHQNTEVILVIEPTNDYIKRIRFSRPVVFVDFKKPAGTAGRDTNARVQYGWKFAKGDIIGQTGANIVWAPNIISTGLKIMRQKGIQAVDGITRRMPESKNNFLGVFQDEALITEFPKYRHDFLLQKKSFAQDVRLPTFTSFLMTRQFYLQVKDKLPTYLENGWEDFNTTRAMVDNGLAIYCSNKLVAYRNHPLGLRLCKHFTSGMSAASFYADNPTNSYAKKRLKLYLAVAAGVDIAFIATSIMMIAYGPLNGIAISLAVLLFLMMSAGVLNAVKARYLWAFFFPPLTVLQVLISTSGFIYGGVCELNFDSEFVSWLHQQR